MLLHQFGQDLVLALEFVLEGSDLTVFAVGVGFATFARVLESSSAVVEELLLPQVEEVHGKVILLTDVGDRLLLQEMEAKQSDLLLRSEVTTLPSHECSSARVLPLTPAKANSSSD
jgi:hypothetical protein